PGGDARRTRETRWRWVRHDRYRLAEAEGACASLLRDRAGVLRRRGRENRTARPGTGLHGRAGTHRDAVGEGALLRPFHAAAEGRRRLGPRLHRRTARRIGALRRAIPGEL